MKNLWKILINISHSSEDYKANQCHLGEGRINHVFFDRMKLMLRRIEWENIFGNDYKGSTNGCCQYIDNDLRISWLENIMSDV